MNEKLAAAISFALGLVSLLFLKLSGFSASSVVNFQNYIIKTGISTTSGMSTLSSIETFLSPFLMIILSLLVFSVALAFAAMFCGEKLAIVSGILAGLSCALIFRSVWGIFVGAGFAVAFFTAAKLFPVYSEEIKKWKNFRISAQSVSRALFIANIIIVAGIFCTVLIYQQDYAVSFKSDMASAMKEVAKGMPGVSALPESSLNQVIETSVNSSEIFNAYIRWLPVTSALGAWFMLELFRNLILTNVAGAVGWLFSRYK